MSVAAKRTPGESGNVADRVSEYLIGHIWDNELAPGAPLPSELQASADLRVSRGIVREVYRSLTAAGIVDKVSGHQPRVGRVTSRVFTQALQHALATRQVSAEQTLELRRPIETYAAALVAARRVEHDVLALRREVEIMRREVGLLRATGGLNEEFIRADIRFHEVIGRATGNPLFSLVVSALREAMEISIRAGLTSSRHLEGVIETHGRIVDAIEAGRPDDARRLMDRHFDEARANVLRLEVERVLSRHETESRKGRRHRVAAGE